MSRMNTNTWMEEREDENENTASASDPAPSPPVDGIKDKEHIRRKEILETAGGGKYFSHRAAEIYAIAKVFEEEISRRRKAQEVDEEQKKSEQAMSLRDVGVSNDRRQENM